MNMKRITLLALTGFVLTSGPAFAGKKEKYTFTENGETVKLEKKSSWGKTSYYKNGHKISKSEYEHIKNRFSQMDFGLDQVEQKAVEYGMKRAHKKVKKKMKKKRGSFVYVQSR